MKLIVGLGNYPEKYAQTRHNMGFLCADALANAWGDTAWAMKSDFRGAITHTHRLGQKILLLKPHTYMNLSGEAVRIVADYYNIEPANILAVYDELDLPFGTIRFREKGSSGGHRGMASLIQHLGTQDVPRLRIGIGGEDRGTIPTEDFVLGKIPPDQWQQLPDIFHHAHKAIEDCFLAPA